MNGTLVLAPVVDGHDVRVVQRRRVLGLGAEAAEEPGVVGERRVQHLHRDPAPQPDVVGDVDAPAPTCTDRRDQAVPVGEDAARPDRRRRSEAWRNGTERLPEHRGTPPAAATAEWDCRLPSTHGRRGARAEARRPASPCASTRGASRSVVGVVLVVSNLIGLPRLHLRHRRRGPPERLRRHRAGEARRPGASPSRKDDVDVRLRDGLTGVLVIDGVRLPEDQLEIDPATSTIVFRPGPDK